MKSNHNAFLPGCFDRAFYSEINGAVMFLDVKCHGLKRHSRQKLMESHFCAGTPCPSMILN